MYFNIPLRGESKMDGYQLDRRRNGLTGRARTEKEWFNWKSSTGEGMV